MRYKLRLELKFSATDDISARLSASSIVNEILPEIATHALTLNIEAIEATGKLQRISINEPPHPVAHYKMEDQQVKLG